MNVLTWLIHTCNMTHSHVWHDSFSHISHDSFICVTWLIQTCHMTHSNVSHDSFTYVTWPVKRATLVEKCSTWKKKKTSSFTPKERNIDVTSTCLGMHHTWDMSRWTVCDMTPKKTIDAAALRLRMHHMCDMTRSTGWWRLIGCPELQIIFHKRATKYRALLRKMTYKDKGSYGLQLRSH